MSTTTNNENPASPKSTHSDEPMDIDSQKQERKQSVHSFRIIDSQETEADKDLIIHSLHESLHIHKEILERIQNEKETYKEQIERERQDEIETLEKWRYDSQRVLDEQNQRCQQLEGNIQLLKTELEKKKEAYQKLEVNFYSYVKQIRVTDDDLSTIQPEISHLLSQLNNTCMGLKSKMNRQGGTEFVFQYWNDRKDLIKKYMMPNDTDLLDISYITLFVEKYLINTLLTNLLDIPIHLGVSVNDAFKEIDEWMMSRNKEWANRLRQQVCALVIQQPGDEETQIQEAKSRLLDEIVSVLSPVYPSLDPKKIENLISRASKLNLAVKGQEIKIERLPIEEGVTKFDSEIMKATAKGKPKGIVFLSVTPTFVARDEVDNEHGFTVPGKVFCIEDESDKEEKVEPEEIVENVAETAKEETQPESESKDINKETEKKDISGNAEIKDTNEDSETKAVNKDSEIKGSIKEAETKNLIEETNTKDVIENANVEELVEEQKQKKVDDETKTEGKVEESESKEEEEQELIPKTKYGDSETIKQDDTPI